MCNKILLYCKTKFTITQCSADPTIEVQEIRK